MNFDLNKTPPTSAELAERRRAATAQLAVAARRERVFAWITYALVGVAAIAVASVYWMGGVPVERLAIPIAIAISTMFVLVGAIIVSAVRALIIGAAVGSVVAAVGAVTVAGASGAVMVGTVALGALAAIAGALAASGVLEGIGVLRFRANAALEGLVELEASSLPDQCIEFMAWADLDETVRAYQRQLATMGRKPVVAEHQAARTWIAGQHARVLEQKKADQARAACERMTAMPPGAVAAG